MFNSKKLQCFCVHLTLIICFCSTAFAGQKIFWVDYGTDEIKTKELSVTSETTIITSLANITAFTVDEVNNKIYWATFVETTGSANIKSANFDGTSETTVFSQLSSHKISDIEIDNLNDKIYWVENGVPTLGLPYQGRIRRTNFSGTVTTTVFTSTDAGSQVYKLALDKDNEKVYWADAYAVKIYSVNYDGSGYNSEVSSSTTLSDGFTIDAVYDLFIFESSLYFNYGNHLYRKLLSSSSVAYFVQEFGDGSYYPSYDFDSINEVFYSNNDNTNLLRFEYGSSEPDTIATGSFRSLKIVPENEQDVKIVSAEFVNNPTCASSGDYLLKIVSTNLASFGSSSGFIDIIDSEKGAYSMLLFWDLVGGDTTTHYFDSSYGISTPSDTGTYSVYLNLNPENEDIDTTNNSTTISYQVVPSTEFSLASESSCGIPGFLDAFPIVTIQNSGCENDTYSLSSTGTTAYSISSTFGELESGSSGQTTASLAIPFDTSAGTIFDGTMQVISALDGTAQSVSLSSISSNPGDAEPLSYIHKPSSDTNLPTLFETVIGSELNSTFTLGSVSTTVSDLNIYLELEYSKLEDLVISVISPIGTEVLLSDGNGSSTGKFACTVFDDEAPNSISLATLPFADAFSSEELLSNFDGENPNGTWTLKIQGISTGETGKLNRWGLFFRDGTGGAPEVEITESIDSDDSGLLVEAEISDSDGDLTIGGSVGGSSSSPSLWWRTDSGAFSRISFLGSSASSGKKNSDKISQVFNAKIPPQAFGSVIEYYVAAQDGAGNVTTFPTGGNGVNPPGNIPPSQFLTYRNFNDSCSQAIEIKNWSQTIQGNTTQATDDGTQSCENQSQPNKSVWYKFTVPTSESWNVSFDTNGSSFDTVLELYKGSCGSLISIFCDNNSGLGNNARIPMNGTFQLPSDDYFLMVSGNGNSSGNFNLNTFCERILPPLANNGNPIPNGQSHVNQFLDGQIIYILGINFTTSSGTNPTSVNVTTQPGQTPNGFANGVSRTFDVSFEGGSNFSSTLTFYFSADERTEAMKSGSTNAEVWQKIDGTWQSIGTGAVVDEGNDFYSVSVNYSASNSISGKKLAGKISEEGGEFGIGDSGDSPLFVEVEKLEAKQNEKSVVLNWATQSEIKNLGFEILRAEDSKEAVLIASYKTHESLVGEDFSTQEISYSFVDEKVEFGKIYTYTLVDVDSELKRTVQSEAKIEVIFNKVETETQKFALHQNFPNPFNPSTTITYEFKSKNHEFGKLTIFNVLGGKVKEFILDKSKGSVVWNGTDKLGKQVSSGTYFYQLEAGIYKEIRKMLLLK